jgi:hypothetical protein
MKGQLKYAGPKIWGVRNIKHLGFSYELESEETTSTFDDE